MDEYTWPSPPAPKSDGFVAEVGPLALAGLVAAVVAGRVRKSWRAGAPMAREYLDGVVFANEEGTWRRRDACENALLVGATGSGKSSLLRWLLARLLDGGGLLICAKATDRSDYEQIVRRLGKRPLILDATTPGLNFFDAVLTPQVALEDRGLAGERAWEAIAAVVNREGRRTASGDNAFFVSASRAFVRFAVDLLSLADVPVTPEAILKIARWVPNTPADLATDRWKGGFLNECLRKAHARKQGEMVQTVSEYFLVQMAGLADRTKAGILSEVAATGDILTRGACKRLLAAGRHNATQLIDAEVVVILDMPFLVHGDVGRACGAGVKFCFQQALLRREVTPGTKLYPVVCDEAQEIVTDEDAAVTAVCRGQRAPHIFATQCLNGLKDKLGSNERAEVLIGNLGTRFVCNPTPFTAKWVTENLVGKTIKTFYSGNASGSSYQNVGDLVTGGAQPTSSTGFSQQMDFAVQFQDLFELRKGGSPDYVVECLWFQAGRRFAGGTTYGYLAVDQKEGR